MNNVLVLGAGMVGGVIAADLSQKYNVTSADKNERILENLSSIYNIRTEIIDISDESQLAGIIDKHDVVVNAVPGYMGFETLKKIISSGKNAADISFFSEDAFLLDQLAKENNVTAVVDCGVAPGLSHIILGYHNKKEKIRCFECYVGGLPFERKLPFQYKAPFSPSDVIEEYTRPARLKENGVLKTRPALSEPQLIDFKEIGTLEAFNSDGLRTLLYTMDIPDMKEKTLRYPGHLEAVKLLRDSGFFSSEAIEAGKKKVKPVDLSSAILFNQWHLNEGDDEFTIMRVFIETDDNKYTYDLFDRRDYKTGFSSMSRTTGFTCTAAVNLLLEKNFRRAGICAPEFLGEDENNFRYILDYLKQRNIHLKLS